MATRAETIETFQLIRPRVQRVDKGRLAKALGLVGIGLGVAQLVAPRKVARLVGTRDHNNLLRSFGLREIASGVGILANRNPTPWMWSRVGGNVLGLATLGKALASRHTDRKRAIAVTAAVAGVTVLDVLCARRLGQSEPAAVKASVIVNRPPEQVYGFWRNLENIPRFMKYVHSVRSTGDRRTHWIAAGPRGRVEWDAELTEDAPNQRISWRTVPESEMQHSGTVRFEGAPGGRGTVVRVRVEYDRPFGKDPEQMLATDLRRFKQLLETDEILTTEGQASGRNGKEARS